MLVSYVHSLLFMDNYNIGLCTSFNEVTVAGSDVVKYYPPLDSCIKQFLTSVLAMVHASSLKLLLSSGLVSKISFHYHPHIIHLSFHS